SGRSGRGLTASAAGGEVRSAPDRRKGRELNRSHRRRRYAASLAFHAAVLALPLSSRLIRSRSCALNGGGPMLDAEHGPSRPTNDTALAEIDLGLLLALEALLHERNVTRAASRLNIGQPALSARLNRLRQVFADPLFVPAAAGRGVVPTTTAVGRQAELADVRRKLRRTVEG